jgi:hypothetical protein
LVVVRQERAGEGEAGAERDSDEDAPVALGEVAQTTCEQIVQLGCGSGHRSCTGGDLARRQP